MRLEDMRVSAERKSDPRQFVHAAEMEETAGDFYWAAARNCVTFYLYNKRPNLNRPKYHSFQRFLSLPIEQARQSNVWRWYFRTGGHPPYDPFKEY